VLAFDGFRDCSVSLLFFRFCFCFILFNSVGFESRSSIGSSEPPYIFALKNFQPTLKKGQRKSFGVGGA